MVWMIEDCSSDENLSLIPEKIEDGKMRFLEGTLSFNAGFSSILTVKNYEFRLKNEAPRYFLGKSFDSFSGDLHHKARKATCLGKLHSLSFYSFSLRIYLKDSFKSSSTSTL